LKTRETKKTKNDTSTSPDPSTVSVFHKSRRNSASLNNSRADKDVVNVEEVGNKPVKAKIDAKEEEIEELPEVQQESNSTPGKKKKGKFVRTSSRNKSPKTRSKKERTISGKLNARNRTLSFDQKDKSKSRPRRRSLLGRAEVEIDPTIWWDYKSKEEMHEIDVQSKGKKALMEPKVPPKIWKTAEDVDQQSCKKYIDWDRTFDNYEDVSEQLIKHSPDPEFYTFPQNDITVEYLKRQHPILPEPEKKCSYHVTQCFDNIIGDYQIYHRNYAHYGGAVSFGKRLVKSNQDEKEKEQQKDQKKQKDQK